MHMMKDAMETQTRRSGVSRRNILSMGAGVAATLALPGCGGGSTDAEAQFDWTVYPAATVGMSANGVEGLRTAIQGLIDTNQIVGAVTAVARYNKLVWYEAQGSQDLASGTPMPKNALFRMASSGKPIAVVAALLMMEEGKLSLDDPVSRFIPEFRAERVAALPPGVADLSQVMFAPAARDITIKDLLTHTAGFMTGGVGQLVSGIQRQPDDVLATYVPRSGSAALDFQPGTKWAYSPIDGIDVVMRIVEIVSGQSIDTFLNQRIFEPLEMADTFFNIPEAKKSRLVTTYLRNGASWAPVPYFLGDGPYKFFSTTAGLTSCAHDYMQFELMLLNQGILNGFRLLRPESVRMMMTNQVGSLFADVTPSQAGYGFGLGVSVLQDEKVGNGKGVGAFGWGGILGTETWADPGLNTAVVVMVQQLFHPAVPVFSQALRKAIVS